MALDGVKWVSFFFLEGVLHFSSFFDCLVYDFWPIIKGFLFGVLDCQKGS